jgi:hypothetical protein
MQNNIDTAANQHDLQMQTIHQTALYRLNWTQPVHVTNR